MNRRIREMYKEGVLKDVEHLGRDLGRKIPKDFLGKIPPLHGPGK